MSLTVCFSCRDAFGFGFEERDLEDLTPDSWRRVAMEEWPDFSAVSKAVSPDLLMASLFMMSLCFSRVWMIYR